MQITTATRTVEIYMNNETGVTYRNTKDGVAYGPVRTANRATAKAGSVGAEILAALDAAEAEAETVAAEVTETVEIAETVAPVAAEVIEIAEGAEVTVAGRLGRVTHIVPAERSRNGHAWAGVLWTTREDGAAGPSHGFAYLDEMSRV